MDACTEAVNLLKRCMILTHSDGGLCTRGLFRGWQSLLRKLWTRQFSPHGQSNKKLSAALSQLTNVVRNTLTMTDFSGSRLVRVPFSHVLNSCVKHLSMIPRQSCSITSRVWWSTLRPIPISFHFARASHNLSMMMLRSARVSWLRWPACDESARPLSSSPCIEPCIYRWGHAYCCLDPTDPVLKKVGVTIIYYAHVYLVFLLACKDSHCPAKPFDTDRTHYQVKW